MLFLETAFRAHAYISRLRMSNIPFSWSGFKIFNFITPAERAFNLVCILVRLIEGATTVVAFVPFTVEIDLPSLNNYLLSIYQGISDLRPCLGINTGECRP